MFRLPDAPRSSASSRQSRLHGAWGLVRATGADRSCRYRGEDGVTIVEVLVAFVLLMMMMLPVGVLFTSVTSQAALARQHQAALQLADTWVEVLSDPTSSPPVSGGAVITNVPAPPKAPPGVAPPVSTLAGTDFTVTANYTLALVNNVGQSDLCANGDPPSPSHPSVIQLLVTVSWNKGKYSLSDSSNINYPRPGLQTEGFLAINLSNDGQFDKFGNSAVSRIEASPVTVRQLTSTTTPPVWISPNPLTFYPDANGCIFAQVPVGTYDVSLNQPAAGTPSTFLSWPGSPAFVTPSGATSDNPGVQTVTVTALTVVQMQPFDEGITSSISYGGASSVDGALTCPAAAGLTCLVTGNGNLSAQAAWGNGTGSWTSANVPSTTNINQVACTTGSSATCVAVGDNASGAVARTTSTNLSSTVADTLPSGVTDLTQVTCPSANGCYAIGSSTNGPVLVAAAVGQGSPAADRWVVLSLPSPAFTSMNSIACPSSSTCVMTGRTGSSTPAIIRLDGDPAGLAGNASWAPTYSADVLPTGAAGSTSVGTVSCPTSTTCLALATGDTAGASDPTVVTSTLSGSGADTWTNESTFPTGASAITKLDCTASTCVAIGSLPGTPSQPAVWTGDLTTSPHTWLQAQNVPTGILAITSASCGVPDASDTADCIFGVITTNASTPGQLLSGTLFGGSWVWNLVTPQVTSSVQYYLGVSCVHASGSANATCMAVAATGNGPSIVTTSAGPNGAWTAQSAPGGNGVAVSGIPLQTAPSSNSDWTTQVTAAAASNGNLTSLPRVLYPDSGGYSLSAGDCSTTASAPAIASLVAIPGDTATAVVPLGLLTIQAVGSNGVPLDGASVTLASTQCAGTNTFALPTTDPAGFTSASVPYGSYTYLIKVGGTTYPANGINLTLGGQAITTQGLSGSAVANYLPVVTQVHP